MPTKILIADDEPTAVEILMKILEDRDYTVITAVDGEEALKAAHEHKPDLIILDVMMPKMNGYDVCKKLKTDDETNEIPIIILTAKDSGEDVKMALVNGANWYVNKPYDPKYLLSLLGNFTRKQ